MSTIPSLPPADASFLEAAQAQLDRLYPGAFFLPLSAFAKLEAITPASARNLICAGTFPIPVVQNRGRNFVAMPDAVAYLASVWQHRQSDKSAAAVQDLEPAQVVEGPKKRGRKVKNQVLKANAAIARAAMARKREAKAAARAAAHAGGAA